MMNKINWLFYPFISILFLSVSFNAKAQEVRRPVKVKTEQTGDFQLKYGMGVSTRYIWRGLDLAKSPALEPFASALFYGFEVSFYGIYGLYESTAKHPDFEDPGSFENQNSLYTDRIAFNEVITNIFYNIKTTAGTFRLGASSYYFPDQLIKQTEIDSNGNKHFTYTKTNWLNWHDNGNGAHVIEANIKFYGNKDFPLWVLIAYNVYNDPDNSLYAETGYTFNLLGNNLRLFAGGAIGGSQWYQFTVKNGVVQSGVGFINFGFTINREIQVEDWLLIDFSLTDVINYYEERNTLLFKTVLRIE